MLLPLTPPGPLPVKSPLTARHYITRGPEKGRSAWWYILLDDDPEKMKEFIHKTQGENAGKYTLNWKEYSTILRAGWGKDPSQEDKDWMKEKYGWF